MIKLNPGSAVNLEKLQFCISLFPLLHVPTIRRISWLLFCIPWLLIYNSFYIIWWGQVICWTVNIFWRKTIKLFSLTIWLPHGHLWAFIEGRTSRTMLITIFYIFDSKVTGSVLMRNWESRIFWFLLHCLNALGNSPWNSISLIIIVTIFTDD